MKTAIAALLCMAALVIPTASLADGTSLSVGGDQYVAGQTPTIAQPVTHDAFAAGYNVTLATPIPGDAHLAGYTVITTSPITGDVYAAGYSVSITAPIGGDVTAFGRSVSLSSAASVGGNSRLAGGEVTIDAPLTGSALISANHLTLGAPINGDVRFYGDAITFSNGARVVGKLYIQAPKPIDVPASVASADQVVYEQMTSTDFTSDASRTAETFVKSFWPQFWVAASLVLLLLIIGTMLIAFTPAMVATLQSASERRPFRKLGFGILTFAMVLGLIPAVALTVVGLLVVPFVLIFSAVLCLVGYLAGAYFLGHRLAAAMMTIDTNLKRVGVLLASIVAATLLGLVPFVGWLIALALMVFGLGVISVVMLVRWTTLDAAQLRPSSAIAATAIPQPIV